jgi:MFS family permease
MKLHAPHLAGNALLYTVTTISCLGFLLIGFDNGLMGGFINSTAFTRSFGIDEKSSTGRNIEALIVSIFEVGAFCGCIATSIFGQDLGRRKSILVGVVIMIMGRPLGT